MSQIKDKYVELGWIVMTMFVVVVVVDDDDDDDADDDDDDPILFLTNPFLLTDAGICLLLLLFYVTSLVSGRIMFHQFKNASSHHSKAKVVCCQF